MNILCLQLLNDSFLWGKAQLLESSECFNSCLNFLPQWHKSLHILPNQTMQKQLEHIRTCLFSCRHMHISALELKAVVQQTECAWLIPSSQLFNIISIGKKKTKCTSNKVCKSLHSSVFSVWLFSFAFNLELAHWFCCSYSSKYNI